MLWVAGETSAYVTDEYADVMQRYFPRVRRVTIKGAGHWVHSEQPETFLEVLRRFVRAEAPDGPAGQRWPGWCRHVALDGVSCAVRRRLTGLLGPTAPGRRR